MTATCIITNCRRRAPASEPFCAHHRDNDGSPEGGDAVAAPFTTARAEGIAQTPSEDAQP